MSKEIQIVPSARPIETEPKELGANLRIVNGEPYAFYNDENGVEKKTHLDNELPSIGAGDDGKVLGVVDGGYALTNVASGGMENPMTAAGDIIVGGTSGAPARLALGTAGQVLKVNDAGTALEYGSAGGGGSSPIRVAPAATNSTTIQEFCDAIDPNILGVSFHSGSIVLYLDQTITYGTDIFGYIKDFFELSYSTYGSVSVGFKYFGAQLHANSTPLTGYNVAYFNDATKTINSSNADTLEFYPLLGDINTLDRAKTYTIEVAYKSGPANWVVDFVEKV